ncbi:MAG: hypothetical protein JST19_09965 [Bacteroidetes bacterium]|nr:hypothetical protein [Bacteroidota bacterium]
MISPFPKEYALSKLIKQGKASIHKDFQPLAGWINKTYDVTTLNILYDGIDRDSKWPTLSIIFEFDRDKRKFYTQNGLNIDHAKQMEVASEFKNFTRDIFTKKRKLLSLFSESVLKYNSENLWVFFHDFEPYAKAEANEQVAESQLKKLQNEIGGDKIWTIIQTFYTAVFFFYTEEQVKEYEKNGMREKLSLRYFQLLKPYDEFNYFKEEDFGVILDSKENFDKNYNSNWGNYFA